MSTSLLIATPFGFQYTKIGTLDVPHAQFGGKHVTLLQPAVISILEGQPINLMVAGLSISCIMQPLGKSYPLPDGWTNVNFW